jgi:hypothetical protein
VNQHIFVKERLAFYEEQDLTPEPGGEWQEAHYPDPNGIGDKTVWMTFDDHQQQGLYQSEEYGRCCFYNYDTLRFLTHGPFVPGWFDLWELYDKWKGHNGKRNGKKNMTSERARGFGKSTGPTNVSAMHGHPNTHKSQVENGEKASKPVLCVETGELYPSAYAASRSTGVRRDGISHSCRKGCRAGGYHWEFVQ